MTEHLAPTPNPDPKDTTRRTRGLVLIALVVGLGLGAAATSVVASRDDDSSAQSSSTESSAAQLSDVQGSCRGWMGSSEGEGSDSAWCSEMFSWMNETSNGSMMGDMMWQDPARMTTACRNWVEQQRDADATSLGRCTDMVQWMDDHMSRDAGRWMMDDHSS